MTEPLLVVLDSDSPNRFASYILEILAVEGYNWVATHDLARAPLNPEHLARHQIVIAGHVALPDVAQQALLDYARGGGNLVLLRPPEALAAHFGLTSTRFDIADRYVSFHRLCALNAGVPEEPRSLQFHGRAELYAWTRSSAQVMAWFEGVKGIPTSNPAIAIGALGQGAWAVFAYDLAESTVLFHQGRRDQASTGPAADADADRKYTLNDHFVGYLDPDLAEVPQADLHQDALVRVLEWMASLTRPLPRLWHYPHGAPAGAWYRGDGDSMSFHDFTSTLATAERFGVPYTVYLMMEDHPKVSPQCLDAYRARGHDFGQHAYAGDLPSPEQMRAKLRDEHAAFRARYDYVPTSYCGHGRVWVGWSAMAGYLHENAVRWNGSYGPGRTFHHGYLGGTGLPVRFVDEDGTPIDVYHQNILSSDDGWVNDKMFFPALSIGECLDLTKSLVDDAVDTWHTLYHGNFHPVRTRPGASSTQHWLEGIMAHTTARGMHHATGAEWVRFNDARRRLRLVEVAFDEDDVTLDLAFEAGLGVEGITLALPHVFRGRSLATALLDGEPQAVEARWLEGRQQVLLSADYAAGAHRRWHIAWGRN